MKKTIKILLVAIPLLVVYNSCDESNLDIPPVVPTEAAFYGNDAEFNSAVLSIYQKLYFFYNYRAGSWLSEIWVLPGDNLTTNSGSAFEIFGSINSSTGKIGDFFRYAYQLISRANVVLEKQIENVDAYEDQNMKAYHRGEALFLRGYMNFQLWNYFGTAPLVTDRLFIETGTPPNSTGNQLLDQAIADFDEASGLLPSSWDDTNLGRATSHAANGMLGKSLLFKATVESDNASYTAALSALNSVSGSLLPVFGDNFDESMENNAESLFEVQLGTNSSNNVWLNNDEFGSVGDLGGFVGYFNGHWANNGQNYIATQGLIDSFDPADPRVADTVDPATSSVLKFVNRPMESSSGVDSFVNAKILRYADVVLMRAEALIQSGGSLPTAIGLINEIRERARGAGTVPADFDTSESNATVVMQWLMDERRRELAMEEGHRWLDIRRWHMGGIINIPTDIDFGSVRTDLVFDTKNLLLPIPSSEILANTNLTQNTGF